MGSAALCRAALALPAAILVMGASTAALASPRSTPARPATRHQPVSTPAGEVAPQIGTAMKLVRNPDGSISVTEG